jgi:hypothetical protein
MLWVAWPKRAKVVTDMSRTSSVVARPLGLVDTGLQRRRHVGARLAWRRERRAS